MGGRGLSAITVNLMYESLTIWRSRFRHRLDPITVFTTRHLIPGFCLVVRYCWNPEVWLFVLGLLFILVPLLMPGGISWSIPSLVKAYWQRRKAEEGDE